MSTKVLVDFSHLACVCYFPALAAEKADPQKYSAKQVLQTNLGLKIQGLRRTLEVDPNEFVFVIESRAEAKYAIFPEYKGNRPKTEYDFKPVAMAYLKKTYPGAKWAYAAGHEADDALATLATTLSPENDVVVVTGDRDLWAILGGRISIYDPVKKKFITLEDIDNAFSVLDPAKITLCKTLWGDAGDNVPNILPRMQKALMPLINDCDGTLDSFLFKTEKANVSGRCRELLTTGRRQIEVNYELVRLRRDAEIDWLG